MFKPSIYCSIATAIAALVPSAAVAEVTEYEDKAAWEASVGDYTTLDFTGFEWGTIITDQYADLGVLFTDGDDKIVHGDPIDDWALDGKESVTIRFDQPQLWFAVDYPGAMQMSFYRDNEWVYTSSEFGGSGGPYFAGITMTGEFDEVALHDWLAGSVYLHNVYFGVPAPGAWCLMALAGLSSRRRRRH